jgi:hypothetical protein
MSKEVFKKLREKYSKYGLVSNRFKTYKAFNGVVDVSILTREKPKIDKRNLKNMNVGWITTYEDDDCFETTVHFWWL